MGEAKLAIKDYESIIQFIKFSIVGLSNTIISLFVYYALLWLGINYFIANIVAWIVSVFNAFYWNNKYVFKNGNSYIIALIRTYMSYGVSFLLGSSILVILIECFDISVKLAPILVLVITIPLNFLMNKYWAFR